MTLETPKMLVLSTAHIRQETDTNFRLMTDDVPSIFYPKVFQNEGVEYGWFIPLIEGDEWSHTVSDDLVAIRKLAEEQGCTWIMLDRDGETTEELPTYDW